MAVAVSQDELLLEKAKPKSSVRGSVIIFQMEMSQGTQAMQLLPRYGPMLSV